MSNKTILPFLRSTARQSFLPPLPARDKLEKSMTPAWEFLTEIHALAALDTATLKANMELNRTKDGGAFERAALKGLREAEAWFGDSLVVIRKIRERIIEAGASSDERL